MASLRSSRSIFCIQLADDEARKWDYSLTERRRMTRVLMREAWDSGCECLVISHERTGRTLLQQDLPRRIYKSA